MIVAAALQSVRTLLTIIITKPRNSQVRGGNSAEFSFGRDSRSNLWSASKWYRGDDARPNIVLVKWAG